MAPPLGTVVSRGSDTADPGSPEQSPAACPLCLQARAPSCVHQAGPGQWLPPTFVSGDLPGLASPIPS